VVDATVTKAHGEPIASCASGEEIAFNVTVGSGVSADQLIVGFAVTTQNGHQIFGQNSLAVDAPLNLDRGDCVTVSFGFNMPRLQPGRYLVLLGISEGTQTDFVEQQWIERALAFDVLGPPLLGGVIELDSPSHATNI
jgi:hypothetical protein